MRNLGRLALIAALGSVIYVAQAQATFTVVSATYTLDSSGPFSFAVFPDSTNMDIDFLPTAPAFKVGDSTGFSSGTATIIYNVVSTVPIIGIDLTLQGDVAQLGEINWAETAEQGTTNLGSISGLKQGSQYAGGNNGAFTQLAHLTFSHSVTSFTIKKTFDMDIANAGAFSSSLADVSIIQQRLDPVPEPASLAALGLGAMALIRRRRK